MSQSQNAVQSAAIKVEKIQISAIQNDYENTCHLPKRRIYAGNKSYTYISQGGQTPTSPFYQKTPKTNQNQSYSQTIKRIFKTINQNKQEDLKLDSQFTKTCTNIKSLRRFNNFFQNKIEGQIRSSSHSNLNYLQQPSTPQTAKYKKNSQDYQGYYSSTFINNMPSQSLFNQGVNSKDSNTSLEQNREKQIPKEVNKVQLFKTYQQQLYSKRNSVGGGKINWMNFKYSNQRRSVNLSIENGQQLQTKNIDSNNSTLVEKENKEEQIPNQEYVSKQMEENQINQQNNTNQKQRSNQESNSNITTSNSITKQIMMEDIINTPNSKGIQSSSLIFSSKNKKNNRSNNKIYQSNNNNTFLGKYKQMNLHNIQNHYKISTFSDFSKLECNQKKLLAAENSEQEHSQTPQSSKNFSLQNRIQSGNSNQYFYSPLKPCLNNFTSSLINMPSNNDNQYNDKQIVEYITPANHKRIQEDSKRLSLMNALDTQDLTAKNKVSPHAKKESQENLQQYANINLLTSTDDKQNSNQDQNQTISPTNKTIEKLNFKKVQIFQIKQEVKTKEVIVYDDTFKMQRRSSKGSEDFEFIQLPFYRKKVVVVPNSNQQFNSTKINKKEFNHDQYQQNNTKNRNLQLQHTQIPMDQFQKFGEFISSQQINNQQNNIQFSSPMNNNNNNNNNKFYNTINFQSNLNDTQVEQLVQKQRQFQLQKGANILKLKEALKQSQNETIMGLISPENRYQTNFYSKKYEQLIQKKR
ncbi:hypothetical protein ABPG74_014863 [Tetrahymena malaccensis]